MALAPFAAVAELLGGRRDWPDAEARAAPRARAEPATHRSGSGSGQTLTLYNAQHEETTDALIKAFTEQTGIKVRVKSDDEAVLTAQIEQEGNRSPADVFFTENSNWLQQLDDRGLLAKVTRRRWPTCPRGTARPTATGSACRGASA